MSFISRIRPYYFQDTLKVSPIQKQALWLGLFLLLVAGIRVYYNIYNYMDIVFGDEVIYMKTGLNITQNFNRDWGPLYCLWYKFLSFFIHDTIVLYYFNFALLGVLSTMAIYVAFLAMEIHPLVAFYFALCFICSKAVVPMWPRISLFTISLLMVGIVIISRLRQIYLRLMVFCIVLLLASYARPEMYLSFCIALVLLVFYVVSKKIYKKKYIRYQFTIFILIVLLLHAIFWFPSNSYNGYPRNLAAFYQHYMINMFYLNKATEFDWIYWKDAHKAIFSDNNNLFTIVLHYPKEFFTHVALNTKNYFKEILGKNICVIFPFLFGKNKLFLAGSFVVFIFSMILLYIKSIRQEFKIALKSHFFYLIMLIVWGIPTVISSIVIFPREHYIMLNYFLFIIPLAILFSIVIKKFIEKNVMNYMLIMAILLIPCLSSCQKFYFFLTDHDKNNMCSRKALEHIRNKHLDAHIQYTFFADIHCFVGFLPNNFKEINTIFDKTKDVSFETILTYNKPDFILVNNCINYSPSLKDDAFWQQFIKNPYVFGYKYEFVKDCPYYYLVRNNLYGKE